MSGVREELKKFIGKELLIDLNGREYAPKGILKEVNEDFIILGESRIIINSIAKFRIADNKFLDRDGRVRRND